MGYIDTHLLPNERIVHRAHIHWRIFFWPAVFILFGLLIGDQIGLLIMLFGALIGTPKMLDFVNSEFAITDRRVLIKRGIIRKSTFELPISKVEVVRLNQKVSERFLGAGSVSIRGTGGTWRTTPKISSPDAFRKHIQAQMHH